MQNIGDSMSSYPSTLSEFKDYVKDSIDNGYFYKPEGCNSVEKHKCGSYDGNTSASEMFSVFNEEYSDPKKMKDFIECGNYSVSAFENTSNSKMEYLVHKNGCSLPDDFVVGSAYNSGDYYPSSEKRYFDVVSGFNANVHGFPCEDSYVLDRIKQGKLRYMGELQ